MTQDEPLTERLAQARCREAADKTSDGGPGIRKEARPRQADTLSQQLCEIATTAPRETSRRWMQVGRTVVNDLPELGIGQKRAYREAEASSPGSFLSAFELIVQ